MKWLSFVSIVFLTASFSSAQIEPHSGLLSQNLDDSGELKKSSYTAIKYHVNQKPIFKDCENYKPDVKEAQERGTKVITIKAFDPDPPTVKGGKLTYSLNRGEGDRVFFNINSTSGEITTNMAFDRDEPSRQKELYVTVQATDDGRPALADICTFKVTIIDINDNSPSFDQLDYRTQVSVDMKVNSEVMRVFAYDFDEGENARLTYSFIKDSSNFNNFFKIDSKTGVVHLKQSLQGHIDERFVSTVVVQDNGDIPNKANVEITISVVSSEKKSPTITKYTQNVTIREDVRDFESPIATIEAESNIADKSLAFELIKGKTIQTNRDQTFTLSQSRNNSAVITLARFLDYEVVTEYQLTVRVQNKDLLDTTVNIIVNVLDVNDEIPTFIELLKGSVVENDDIGVQAMQVRAIDKDGTSPNNLVRYELLTQTDLFEINESTGIITSKVKFDREEENLYHVIVRAHDMAPSDILRDKTKPNSANQTFQISIEDTNDNNPKFTKGFYIIHNISESQDVSKEVGEVLAVDSDTATDILYSIIEGNIDEAFAIENTTGRIRINKKLDYEKIESYNLTVRAFDGLFEDTAKVYIFIQNENDERPVFYDYDKDIYIQEEFKDGNCIINLKAYDPDIKDRTADQRIKYEISRNNDWFLNVTETGCVTLIKELDRDLPNGAPSYQGFIIAHDENAGPNSLITSAEINIILIDVNDNAPILNLTEVVWYENEAPGQIVVLSAIDYDEAKNGPPFKYEISDDAGDEIIEKFSVNGDNLMANVVFDREEKKFYDVRIRIFDSGTPPQAGVSTLRVIIGDRNDNAAKDGSSEIFVYTYKQTTREIKIGRVYVDDPDDWDLPDKHFRSDGLDDNFDLSPDDKGMILLHSGTREGVYNLNFVVTESLPNGTSHDVKATVKVTVKDIPEEAIIKSGSIRFIDTTIEEFIEKSPESGLSKKDIMQRSLSKILNASLTNVDVFTVLTPKTNRSYVDVRFSAHGSPYYPAERLNNKASEFQSKLERELAADILMVSINECLNRKACPENSSCTNRLKINDEPAVVFTNKTSFVGVSAVAEAVCDCVPEPTYECFNGGSPLEDGCSCPEGFEGPHCEILGVGFDGNGWAMYPTFESCNLIDLSLSVLSQTDDGLIFFAGPLTARQALVSKSFMSLEVRNGFIVLKLDLGHESIEVVSNSTKITDGTMHKINAKIDFVSKEVQIFVDDCTASYCLAWGAFQKSGRFSANGPLQVGGRRDIFTVDETHLIWSNIVPIHKGFTGCITNLTFNSLYHYNLGMPSDSHLAHANCNFGMMQAVTFGIDTNFLVAILVCVAILFILLLAVVVHRRKQDNLNEKDMDDTRENIINYEDEGGGECDTNFDLTVLRPPFDEKPPITLNPLKQAPVMPDKTTDDISGFLGSKKDNCDRDPDNLPFDDVRHYGYEGDGNTSGSLSSLASCTDEGDLKFNYLSSFGPRFRKLADMYGDDASEDDSQNGGEESWC